MTELHKKIHAYLMEKGYQKEDLIRMDQSSVSLSMEMMEYAHRNQKRENGEQYANHPLRCFQTYRDMVGITWNNDDSVDKNLLFKNDIPYDGVQEVCLLHDVIEDTDITIEELKAIFSDCGFETYFDLYVKEPLTLITHKKSMDYDEYVLTYVMKNSISSIVKMIDMQDNLNMIGGLVSLDKSKYERSARYLKLLYLINSKYRFIENLHAYKKKLEK